MDITYLNDIDFDKIMEIFCNDKEHIAISIYCQNEDLYWKWINFFEENKEKYKLNFPTQSYLGEMSIRGEHGVISITYLPHRYTQMPRANFAFIDGGIPYLNVTEIIVPQTNIWFDYDYKITYHNYVFDKIILSEMILNENN